MLLDSNIIIYASLPEYDALRRWIREQSILVSAVSYMEVLGYHQLTPAAREDFRHFFAIASLLPLDQPVLDTAVRLRQLRRISLGDALIAATALVHNQILVTHNLADFQWVPGLRLFDPLAEPG